MQDAEQKTLNAHLLDEFINYLNPRLTPIVLVNMSGSSLLSDGRHKAVAFSRDFGYAELVVGADDVCVSGHGHLRDREVVRFSYADPHLFRRIARHLRRLSDEVVTPGWSDPEVYRWEHREIRRMEKLCPSSKNYGRAARRSLLRKYGLNRHSDWRSARCPR